MIDLDSLWIKATEVKIHDIGCGIDSIQYQIDNVCDKQQLLSEIIEVSNSSVSNQLSAANWLLVIVGFIIAGVGIFLSIYIDKKKKEIVEISTTIEANKVVMEEIAKTTKKLDEKINNDIEGLYRRLRVEETNAFLDRLICEPLDISNIVTLLLARDLDSANFYKLKEAYLKFIAVKDDEGSVGDLNVRSIDKHFMYILLFFQHFSYLSLKDDDVRPWFIQFFGECIKRAFRRDMIKSTIDICKALSEEDSTFNKEDVLSAYLKALNDSKFKDLAALKNLFVQNITPKSLLINAIERCKKDGIDLVMFNKDTFDDKG